MTPIRVLIVDDHVVVRTGIQMFLGTEPSVQVVGEAEDGQEAVQKAVSLKPDVILMDLVMPGRDGIQAIADIKHFLPQVKIIALTTFQDEARVNAAIEAGADGYLLKDADAGELIQAIHTVRQGDMPLHPHVTRHLVRGTAAHEGSGAELLTKRQKEVLRLVARGLNNKSVAQDLNISEGTVKVHISNILSRLNVSCRTEAAVWAIRAGLISPEHDS